MTIARAANQVSTDWNQFMRCSFRVLPIAASAALTAGLLSGVAVSANADEAVSEPIALHGPMPAENADVAVFVQPRGEYMDAGEEEMTLELPDAQTTTSPNDFSIFIAPESIPASYVGEDGLVDFTIYVSNSEATWTVSRTARITVMAGDTINDAFWAPPEANGDMIVDGDEGAARTSGSSASVAVIEPQAAAATAESGEGAESTDSEVNDDGTNVGGGFVEEAPTDPTACAVVATDAYSTRSTTIGTTYPAGAVQARMKVANSDGASYGIGLDVEGDGNGFKANGSKFVETTWSFEWAWSDKNRSYRKGIQYRKYNIGCGHGPAATYKKEWRPNGETGGTGTNNGIDRPDWGNCAAQAAGTWRRDQTNGSAYALGTAVKFVDLIGIDLMINRQYSTNQYVAYDFPNNNFKLCGSNNYPSVAGKVMAKFR